MIVLPCDFEGCGLPAVALIGWRRAPWCRMEFGACWAHLHAARLRGVVTTTIGARSVEACRVRVWRWLTTRLVPA